MDVVYETVESAAHEIDALAVDLDGLERRLDQYAAAKTGEDALPREMEGMEEMREEIAAYFRDTLPHSRMIASWGYRRLEPAMEDLQHALENPREVGLTRETVHETKEAYRDSLGLSNQYFALLNTYDDLDQRAAELVGPEVVAQAREDALDVPQEPVRATKGRDNGSGTTIQSEDDEADTYETGADRFDALKREAREKADSLGLLDDLTPREKVITGAAAAGAAAWLYKKWRRG